MSTAYAGNYCINKMLEMTSDAPTKYYVMSQLCLDQSKDWIFCVSTGYAHMQRLKKRAFPHMSEHRTSFHFKRSVDTIIMGNGKIMEMRATVTVTRHTVLTELSRFSTRAFLRLSMLNCFTSCSASAIRRSSLFLYNVQEKYKLETFLVCYTKYW